MNDVFVLNMPSFANSDILFVVTPLMDFYPHPKKV